MNLFIYVLLLSIWINSCLNTNQSDGSSTTGAKHVQPTEIKMDNFRRRLLVIVIGIMIIAFVFTCFCFLHYNCMSDDAPKAGTVRKEDVTTKSSRSSKISFSESKIASPCILEKQSVLSSIDKLSVPSSPEKSSIPSSAEKLRRSLSPGKQCISSSPEKSCQYYEEKCLVCRNSSEPLVNNISEAKNSNVQNSPVSSEVQSFSKSCHKGDYRDNVLLCGNVSSSDITINSDDSDREITIICT
ncbi:uncharacterized protein CXorf66 homolog [Mustela nigripes]|uniref:uncharacterized protein CXorf66 homolog n=1 Tax=Mustela nigripes TaxID=77151 RepID=UPI0028149D6A|nr:uncharacterized protein CXorf66 homolog [Mustela nigripes]